MSLLLNGPITSCWCLYFFRVSSAVSDILQKLCVILGFLKELGTIERLPDSCILQLIKTCFTTLVVENIQRLQLESISLISRVMKLHYYKFVL